VPNFLEFLKRSFGLLVIQSQPLAPGAGKGLRLDCQINREPRSTGRAFIFLEHILQAPLAERVPRHWVIIASMTTTERMVSDESVSCNSACDDRWRKRPVP
jgi:hypothetical protein